MKQLLCNTSEWTAQSFFCWRQLLNDSYVHGSASAPDSRFLLYLNHVLDFSQEWSVTWVRNWNKPIPMKVFMAMMFYTAIETLTKNIYILAVILATVPREDIERTINRVGQWQHSKQEECAFLFLYQELIEISLQIIVCSQNILGILFTYCSCCECSLGIRTPKMTILSINKRSNWEYNEISQ